MENNKRKITLYDIVAVGLLAAFVFIATFFFKIKSWATASVCWQARCWAAGAAAWPPASAARCST